MSDLTIYGFAGSTYVRTARMACEEKRVTYDLEPVDYGSEAHAEVHPYRRMPAMRNGTLLLFEALAISAYVDAIGPAAIELQPGDAGARALMLQWVSAVNDYVYPDVVRALLSDEQPTAETLSAARDRLVPFDRALAESEWLTGDQISLADLFLAPIDAFAEPALDKGGALEGLGGLGSWRDRVRARASFAATAPEAR